MPRHNPQPHSGLDPESTFDHWLDGLVTGTPVAEPSRNDGPMGRLTQAQSGARQLHELSAHAAMASGAMGARQRIKEGFMHNGTLVGYGGSASWIPPRTHDRQTPWWSLNSPVISGALIFALIVSMAGALFLTQRPDPSPAPTGVPGFAVASPGATPEHGELSCGAPGYRPVVSGPVDADALAMIGDTREPIVRGETTVIEAANGAEIVFPEGTRWAVNQANGVILSIDDENDPDTVTSLSTGESWTFPHVDPGPDTPPSGFVLIGPWLIGVTDTTMTDWRIIDTRTGEERLTSEIFGGPFDHSRVPFVGGPWFHGNQNAKIIRFVTSAPEGSDSPVLTVVISANIDSAYVLGEEHAFAGANGVVTPDGERIAYVQDRTIRVLDTTSGEMLAEYPAPETSDVLAVSGVSSDGQEKILQDSQQVWTVDLDTGDIAVAVNPDSFIQFMELDAESGNLLIGAGERDIKAVYWHNPITGETRELDLEHERVRTPSVQFGWALLLSQSEGDERHAFALLDMATGEITTTADSPYASETNRGVTWSFGDDGGTFVADPRTGELVVLDGPGARSFTLAEPENADRPDNGGVGIGVSPSNECVVFTVAGQNGEDGTSWIASLEPDAEWTHLDAELQGWEYVGDSDAGMQTLPAQDFASPEATPAIKELDALFPTNAVPVFSSGPIDELSPDRYGAVGDEGLTIPLRNGEVFSLPDAVRVSQVLHTGIAIVDYANGDRTSIDLDTGETLTDLYPPSDNERIVGVYQLTHANDDMTDWRILDLRTGDETSTEHLFGTTFDMHADPIAIAVDLAHPSTMLAQFVEANSGTGQPEPVSIESSTLLIPGSLEDATFTDQNHGYAFGLPQTVALETRDGTTMFAYVTDMPDAVIRVENGSSGETVATFTAGDIDAEGQVHIAGFVDNGTSLVVWSGSTVSLLELDDQATVTRFETNGDTIQHILGTSVILTSSREGASAMWNHLDLESGEWTEFPELDGFEPDRSQPQSPWVTLRAGGGPSLSMVIINDVTGEIVARLDDANLGMSTAVSPAHDFSALAITGNTGEAETTGYMLDATSGESWQIAPPDTNGSVPDGIFYSISPDGALLVATSHDPQGGDIETWVSPVQPEPEWTSIGPRSIDTWLYFPDDDSQDQTEVSGRILDCRVFLAT